MMEDLEELVDDVLDMLDDVDGMNDIEEYNSTEELPTRYQDNEYLRGLGILIDRYEE